MSVFHVTVKFTSQKISVWLGKIVINKTIFLKHSIFEMNLTVLFAQQFSTNIFCSHKCYTLTIMKLTSFEFSWLNVLRHDELWNIITIMLMFKIRRVKVQTSNFILKVLFLHLSWFDFDFIYYISYIFFVFITQFQIFNHFDIHYNFKITSFKK